MKRDVISCAACPVSQACVPFQLGLAGDTHARVMKSQKRYAAKTMLVRSGVPMKTIAVVQDGWTAQYDLLSDGRRQILEVGLPGDVVYFEDQFGPQALSAVVALSDVRVCEFSHAQFYAELENQPRLALKWLQSYAPYARNMHELVVSLGRRSAPARIARLILCIHSRVPVIATADGAEIPFHFRQQDIADYIGLTQVHVSRVFHMLSRRGILDWSGSRLTIHSIPDLLALART